MRAGAGVGVRMGVGVEGGGAEEVAEIVAGRFSSHLIRTPYLVSL